MSNKYWVGYNKADDEFYFWTINTSQLKAFNLMEEMFGEHCFVNKDLKLVFVEIKMVEDAND